MSKLGDYYFIKELLDRETALSHNDETGYYSVNNAYFSSNFTFPESSYAYSFYNAMRAVFRSNYDYSNDSGFSNHETLHFFTFSGDDNLYYCFHNTPGIRGNTSKYEYYEVQFNPQLSTRNIYKYDTTTNEISVYSDMSSGGSYKSVPVYKFLASTGGLFPWGTNTNINYVNIEGNSGNSSGGWQVPNPNPTRKIVVNGVNYSDDNGEDPNYNWYYNDDKTLIVRESKADGSFRWYFNNVYIPDSSPFLAIPSNLTRFDPGNVGVEGVVSGNQTISTGVVGFYNSTIRLWNEGLTYNQYGYAKAILESTDSGISRYNEHTWEDPNIPTGHTIKLNGATPKKIMLNGECYYERQDPPPT